MAKKFSVSEEEMFADNNEGICLACGERQGGCEPDAQNIQCESCGEPQVCGIEEAVLMGKVDVR